MFDPTKPEEVQAVLLHIAAASGGAPTGRPWVARLLRAALALVEDAQPQASPVPMTPDVAKALDGIHAGLAMMTENAELLAERAAQAVPERPG